MTAPLRRVLFTLACATAMAATPAARAQILYSSGQNVAPVFEGWQRNADGTVSMVFAYLNRNHEEELDIPVGPDNRCDPAPIDCGQPTYFYTRRQRFVFRVALPKDWPKDRKLLWVVASHGKTDTAKGVMLPEMEIDNGSISENLTGGILAEGNQPPTIVRGSPPQTITLPNSATLTIAATDDGNPKPRPQPQRAGGAAGGSPNAPAAAPAASPAGPAANLAPDSPQALEALARRGPGVRIRWIHYRGPGKVTFDPATAPAVYGKPSEMTTTVSFGAPGVYVLRAIATDGQLETTSDATVTVKAAGSK